MWDAAENKAMAANRAKKVQVNISVGINLKTISHIMENRLIHAANILNLFIDIFSPFKNLT